MIPTSILEKATLWRQQKAVVALCGEVCLGGAPRTSRAGKPLFVILSEWIPTIIRLSKPIERTTPRAAASINCGLGMITVCQRRLFPLGPPVISDRQPSSLLRLFFGDFPVRVKSREAVEEKQ